MPILGFISLSVIKNAFLPNLFCLLKKKFAPLSVFVFLVNELQMKFSEDFRCCFCLQKHFINVF